MTNGLRSVWGVAALARKTNVDTEVIIYAVLDVLAKPIFGLWLLVSHRAIAETNIELGGYWSQGLPAEGRIRIGEED
jgi:bacteriorhodopsin